MLTQLSFRNHLKNSLKSSEKKKYLLAVSGGADSMVLAHLFEGIKDLGYHFQIAHINYKLRGEDSEADQKVVDDFCKTHSIKFHSYSVSEKDEKPEGSIQLWARTLRYRFFDEICQKENLDYLVTAHHLNDQLETFIINLSRGSGISGLTGIPSNENNILRPLLNFSKEEIYEFARENSIEFREDLSNKKNDYLRNKIRNTIVPNLCTIDADFLNSFKKSLNYLNQTKEFVQQQIKEIEEKITISDKENIILNKEKLNLENDFVQFEILKKYGFTKVEEIKKIFTAETGSTFFSKNYQLNINRNEIVLIKIEEKQKNISEIILTIPENEDQNNLTVNLSDQISIIDTFNKDFYWEFNADKLTYPLKLRNKKEGDFFYPIHFSGKKKVSKFFKDEKIPNLAKQKIWLLTDGNDEILGVIPFRQDRKYAKDEKTNTILTILYEK